MHPMLFFVGKPYPHLKNHPVLKRFRFGLLLDKNVKLRDLSLFDPVIEVDYTSPEVMLKDLPEGLKIDGLLCTYENYLVARSQLATHFGLPAPSVKSAKASTDKYLMREAFQKYNPAISPNFKLVEGQQAALDFADSFGYPLIIKPTNLVKSLLVLRCDDQQQLIDNFEYAHQKVAELYKRYRIYDRQPQLIIEEYMKGPSYSVAAFVDSSGQAHCADGIVALTNAQDIGVNDNYLYNRVLPADLPEAKRKQMFEVASQGIKALEMSSTPAHVELIDEGEQVKLIEIGARIGGYRPRMYELSYGLDLIEQEVSLALGQQPEVSADFKAYSAVYELFPDRPGNFRGIEGQFDEQQFEYFRIKAKPGQLVGLAKEGFKAAAVITLSDSDKQNFEKLRQIVEKLKISVE